jgi:microcin C transport system substrate-binding protein
MPGIRVPAIDELIDSLGKVKTRKQLNIVMRCLDRVLRAHAFWIPNWYSTNHRVAMWDIFAWSEPKPDFGFPVESIWWLDQAKAKRIGKG